MKTILYMASTLNGFIAKTDYDSNWTSSEDLKKFSEISKKCGNVIFGHTTYEVLKKENNFPLKDRLNIVMTHNPNLIFEDKNVIITNQSPRDILSLLENRGIQTAFIAGGGKTNLSFIKENLVDEIYLTIEPLILGRGIPLFAPSDFEINLQLLETAKLSQNEIQLHYQVVK
jgi:dihydrofolate reductase